MTISTANPPISTQPTLYQHRDTPPAIEFINGKIFIYVRFPKEQGYYGAHVEDTILINVLEGCMVPDNHPQTLAFQEAIKRCLEAIDKKKIPETINTESLNKLKKIAKNLLSLGTF